ncbi:MAG: AbrB/MazE/SpoVT family DNA-binding domain-containing protein [Lachnospiraceae bacterium]|nr:AbrB/MazE/SpoVT family DNA-binding domain-containing protein [Lachnospiraceae bacterium]MBQ8947944.1 AbrB/MazE/SpoVT family DNA-binding domain-containing protein [Lachnospiraceae bacterium]
MDVAKVFSNGGSQAVRLPKTCRFDNEEVFVNRIGNVVMLFPKEDRWQSLLTSLDLFTDDFLSEEIGQLPLEEREVVI